MSIHFAPQWVKPIKPSGTSLTPTTETAPNTKSNQTSGNTVANQQASQPFPALSNLNGSNNTYGSAPSHTLSYSRATHTPVSPGVTNDSSYFPYQEANGSSEQKPHPFRYSREQILGLWDEDKVKKLPIEFVDLVDAGVLVTKTLVKPIGLRDLNEIEKKLLSTSIHPPAPVRRPGAIATPNDPVVVTSSAPRRTLGNSTGIKDSVAPVGTRSGAGAFGGFGRGEGGAFGSVGSGKIGSIGSGVIGSGPIGEGRAPGALGGGFGGVGRRIGGRRTESGDPTAWRSSKTASGNFEGVLGFGGGPAAPASSALTTPTSQINAAQPQLSPLDPAIAAQSNGWNEKGEVKEKEKEVYGNGGGPGWGTGQKKWRMAANVGSEQDRPTSISLPVNLAENRTESVAPVAPDTPVPERDATVDDVTGDVPQLAAPLQEAPQTPAQSQEKEDLSEVEWYYRDPNSQEQGPFTGKQMHDWYSHAYFTDDLPLRRAPESSFHTLAELKTATGNGVQPFLSHVRPRTLPPNLPIPMAALQQSVPQPNVNLLNDNFRNVGLGTPSAADQRITPQPLQPMFNQYLPDRAGIPNQFQAAHPFLGQIPSPAGSYMASPSQAWASPGPQNITSRLTSFGSVGLPSPIGSAPLSYAHSQGPPQQPLYSPAVGNHIPRDPRNDFFSPSVGVGAIPPSPWGVQPSQPPQQQHQQPWGQVPMQQQQPIQPPTQYYEQQQPQQQQQQQQSFQQYEQMPEPTDQAAQSYFPSPARQEESQIEQAVDGTHSGVEEFEHTQEPQVAEAVNEVAEEEHYAENSYEQEYENEVTAQAEPEVEEDEEEAPRSPSPAPTQTPSKAPVSAWGQIPSLATPVSSNPPSRKSSIAGPTPAAAAKAPAAQASVPAKQAVSVAAESTPVATPEKATTTPRPAPWAQGDKDGRTASAGPSLREIQEAEAKRAEQRKAALARAAAPSPSLVPASEKEESIPTSMSWGLPSSGTRNTAVSSPSISSPAAPVWGGGDAAAPKKTMKQIQEEEEKRRLKAAAAAKAAAGPAASAVGQSKRGYADLAAISQPPPGAGWTTVGAKPSPVATATATPRAVSTPVAKPLSSIITGSRPSTASSPSAAKVVSKSNGSEESGPSVEFIKWTKGALTGLNVNVDDFIQMLLTFPIDPPASSRPEVLEIISDSVYANSSTLDGRRFAQDFFTKRKADAARPKGASGGNASWGSKTSGSLADVVKSVPKKSEDAGFRVVKAKGKKKTT